jgi:hypothetical protein
MMARRPGVVGYISVSIAEALLMVHRMTLPFFRGNIRLVGQLFRNTERFDTRQPAFSSQARG